MSWEPPTVDALTSELLITHKYRGVPLRSQAAGDGTTGSALLPHVSDRPSPHREVF